jgi:CRISPR-associated endonuclease/helicase Cas3
MSMELPRYIAHLRKAGGDPQSLEEHLLGVAEIAQRLASKIGLEPQGELIGLLHDLGKYSNEFQAYLKSAVGLINQDEDEFVDVRSERQPGNSLTSMKDKVKQRPWQLMRM